MESIDGSGTIEKAHVAAVLEQFAAASLGDRILLIGEVDGGGKALLADLWPGLAGENEHPGITVYSPARAAVWLPDTGAFPHPDGFFDVIVCDHIATRSDLHAEFLAGLSRISCPGGLLLIIDNLIPGTRLRGKKARQIREAGTYINAWTRLWRPDHQRYLDLETWQSFLVESGWRLLAWATRRVPVDFDTWCASQTLEAADRIRLRAMLVQAPEKVSGFLTPLGTGDRMSFHLTEGFILAVKPSDTL